MLEKFKKIPFGARVFIFIGCIAAWVLLWAITGPSEPEPPEPPFFPWVDEREDYFNKCMALAQGLSPQSEGADGIVDQCRGWAERMSYLKNVERKEKFLEEWKLRHQRE